MRDLILDKIYKKFRILYEIKSVILSRKKFNKIVSSVEMTAASTYQKFTEPKTMDFDTCF